MLHTSEKSKDKSKNTEIQCEITKHGLFLFIRNKLFTIKINCKTAEYKQVQEVFRTAEGLHSSNVF